MIKMFSLWLEASALYNLSWALAYILDLNRRGPEVHDRKADEVLGGFLVE